MVNNCFNDYAGFTTILKGKLPPKFTKLDIKFHRPENPNHHLRNYVSAMTLKEIDKDIFHLIFPLTFDKDIMRGSNVVEPRKVMNWEDLYKEFLR